MKYFVLDKMPKFNDGQSATPWQCTFFRWCSSPNQMGHKMHDDDLTRRLGQLSEQQRACLRLVDQGMQSKEISPQVGLTPNVVDTYLKSAAAILGVSGRRKAARILVQAELNPTPKLEFQSPAIVGDAQKIALDGTSPADRRIETDRGERDATSLSTKLAEQSAAQSQREYTRNHLLPWQRIALILAIGLLTPLAVAGVLVALEKLVELRQADDLPSTFGH